MHPDATYGVDQGNYVNMVDNESFMRTQVGACALLV